MATLTPGEILGVLKENNAQLLTQISAIFSANSSPAPTGAYSSGNGVTGDLNKAEAQSLPKYLLFHKNHGR